MRHVIAHVRLAANLTQSDLAAVLKCSGATVQRIEQGTLSLSESMALKAQKLLNVSAVWLFLNDPSKPPVTPAGQPWSPVKLKQSIQEKQRDAILLRLEAADKQATQTNGLSASIN